MKYTDPFDLELRGDCLEILDELDDLASQYPLIGAGASYPDLRSSLVEIADGQPLTPARVVNLLSAMRVLHLHGGPEQAMPPMVLNRAARRAQRFGRN